MIRPAGESGPDAARARMTTESNLSDRVLRTRSLPDGADSNDGRSPSPGPNARGESAQSPVEIGGPKGPEPTRYGDWERKGRCVDF
jgi:hypothetical protein